MWSCTGEAIVNGRAEWLNSSVTWVALAAGAGAEVGERLVRGGELAKGEAG